MKQGIIIAHGSLGRALIEAVQAIMGTHEGLFDISVENMSAKEIYDRLASIVKDPQSDDEGVVVMACLRGGSSWNVASAVAEGKKYVKVISGANLPMILTFLTKRKSHTMTELVSVMHDEAVKGIALLGK